MLRENIHAQDLYCFKDLKQEVGKTASTEEDNIIEIIENEIVFTNLTKSGTQLKEVINFSAAVMALFTI